MRRKDELVVMSVMAAAGMGALLLALNLQRRFPVRGKIVLVTGSSRGLGLALAEAFGRAGARVVLTARSEEELTRAADTLIERGALARENLLVLTCDLCENAQVQTLVAEVRLQWGPIDVLVNNAGVISVGPVESQSVNAFEDAIRSNYLSMVYTSLAVMPEMLARSEGAIVNIASIGGKVAVPHLLPYTASKFAAVGFSQGLHAELRAKGVRVTTVTPGLLRTGSPRHAQFTGRRAEEFRWFNLGDSLPGVSRDALGAARRILRATETGEGELSITLQAALAARLAQAAPGVTAALSSAVNRLLPEADPEAQNGEPGSAHDEKDLSALTGAGRMAEERWNEV